MSKTEFDLLFFNTWLTIFNTFILLLLGYGLGKLLDKFDDHNK